MQLRQYQENAVTAFFRYFHETQNPGNPLVLMPTGTGKSVVIGALCQRILNYWPRQRILVLTHVKELLEQNYNKLQQIWPGAPAGIFSAGLNRRDYSMPVVFGGVASVHGCEHLFGWRDLILVDEAHLISGKDDSMYSEVFASFKALNPAVRIVGFTATDYRLGMGRLTENGIFDDVCYDITKLEEFNSLVAQGFIAPIYPKDAETKIDLSQVSLSKGEFQNKQLESATEEITERALTELCFFGQYRKSWLIFASGTDNAEHCNAVLNAWGIPSTVVHSKIKNTERDDRIDAFKAGEYRAIVNNNILTTGFDHPPIDLIGCLRATMSPGLWVQMLGRGTRPSPETGKHDCLAMDFAGNTQRLGPINDPRIPTRKGDKVGDAPVRICDNCGVYNHASARFCIACKCEFTFQPKVFQSASIQPLMRTVDIVEPITQWFDVVYITYSKHQKKGSAPSMMVAYYVSGEIKPIYEFVNLEHPGPAKHFAHEWWKRRHAGEPPTTVAEALERQSELKQPRKIRVHTNIQFPKVLNYEF